MNDFDGGIGDPMAMRAQAMRAVRDAAPVACECGSHFFKEVVMIKMVSSLYVGGGSGDGYSPVPIPVYVCDKCGKVIPFMREEVEKEFNKEEKTDEPKSSIILT